MSQEMCSFNEIYTFTSQCMSLLNLEKVNIFEENMITSIKFLTFINKFIYFYMILLYLFLILKSMANK